MADWLCNRRFCPNDIMISSEHYKSRRLVYIATRQMSRQSNVNKPCFVILIFSFFVAISFTKHHYWKVKNVKLWTCFSLFRKKSLRSTFWSREILQNFLCLCKKNIGICSFFFLHFEQLINALVYGPPQVKCPLLISSIFDAINSQHFSEML